MNFNALVHAIADIHRRTQSSAAQAVDAALTFRAERLQQKRIPRSDQRELRRFRQFYLTYPQIRDAMSPEFGESFQLPEKRDSASPESGLPASLLVGRLSFTHFRLLLEIDDPLKRAFYEIESIKGNWAVRELKRQIGSLYFERSGLSHNKERLSEIANAVAAKTEPKDVIRDPYVFEFLGLRPQEVLPESDLESALIEKLQNFLLELGHGFCFEGRQERLVIGGEALFVDLVFYPRVLKCHVLVELKVDEFRHEHLGQLNTYVSYYRAHEMTEGDQPPVGILLCTGKNHALVEYSLAGMDNRLFVSKYQLQLPKPDEVQRRLLEAGGKKCGL